jgi:hypothetical protein
VNKCQQKQIFYLDGKTELRGGSDQDWAETREWMSLFWHDAVVREVERADS